MGGRGNFIFVILFLIIIINPVSANKDFVIYGRIKMESSVLNDLLTENKTQVRVYIFVNESFLEIETLKTEIISSLLNDEFKIITNLKDSGWFYGELTKKGLEKLKANTNIVRIDGEKIGGLALSQSVPWIDVKPEVWSLGYSGKDQTICVIDTGVNASHPDLQSKILAEKCYCSINEGANPYCCPDGTSEDDNAKDNNGHGTHVVGIIASQDATYRGVSPNASVVVIKVTNSSGNWADNNLASGIQWCIDNAQNYNISIITISLGTKPPYLYNNINNCENDWVGDTQINSANASGIFVDLASGNNYNISYISYPACVRGAMAIGSSYKDQDTIFSAFTNRGNLLEVLAPGSDIWSLRWNQGSCLYSCICSDERMRCSGTSMAAPHVAGIVALLLERDPTLTPDEIRNILREETNVSIYDSYTPTSGLTYPRVNALLAINSLCTCTSWFEGSCGGGTCLDSERQYTRTCTPSACDDESKCEYDTSCGPGPGEDITVCASGCDYDTILDAVRHSDVNDKIIITDNGNYNENVILNASTSPWLECRNNSRIYGTDNEGVRLKDVDVPTVFGCTIDGFTHGTRVASVIASQNEVYRGIAYGAKLYVVRVTNNNGDFLESSFDAIKFSFNSADENFADLRVGGSC